MENKLSGSDIHNVLDTFGSSPDGSKTFPKGGVDFTDPLLVKFKSEKTAKKSKEKKNNYFDTLENVDTVWFDNDNSSSTFLQNDWQELFDIEDYLPRLREIALYGKLKQTNYRGLCWKLFWDCLPEEREHWIEATETLRNDYKTIRDKHIFDPCELSPEVDLHVNNPLSQEEESPWHQYFQDSELNQTILQDLQRLYPELDFFQQEEIRNILLNCLFCYGKEHPEVDYKQGMHEILAPIVYVLWDNAQSVKESKEDLQDMIRIINDEKHVEHDAYCLFSQIMETMEPLFLNNRNKCNNNELNDKPRAIDHDNLFVAATPGQPISAISKKLTRIQNYMLKRYDHQLYSRLQELDIAPQLYGIRWIRLLYGREFPLNKLLYLWDAMFADGMSLDLSDYIFIAMLISIRGFLLKNDYSSCLVYLMKYPSSIDAKTILKKALALKNSKPQGGQAKKNIRVHQNKTSNRNASLVRQLNESLTQEQRFAQILGSSKSAKPKQVNKQTNQQNTTWYAHNNEIAPPWHQEETKQDGRSEQQETAKAQISETRKPGKSQRFQVNKPNVVSQISSAIGKHTAGLSNEVLSKLSARSKHRPKESNVSQLEEDHERLQKQVCQLQSELDKLQSLCLFCAGKMNSYIGFIDIYENDDIPKDNEVASSCIAGLKKVRDVLKSSIELEPNTESYERKFSSIDRRLSAAFECEEANDGKNPNALQGISERTLQDLQNPLVDKEFDTIASDNLGSNAIGSDSLGSNTIVSDSLGSNTIGSDSLGSNTIGFDSLGSNTIALDAESITPGLNNTDSEIIESNNEAASKDAFDYPGYGNRNTTAEDQQSLVSSNSDKSLNENSSDTSSPSSSTSQETWGIQPINSPGDFEKELLSIRNKYNDKSKQQFDQNNDKGTALEDLPMHGSSFIGRTNEHDTSSQFLDPLSALEQHFS